MRIPCSLTVVLLFPLLVNAYTWQFTSPLSQCGNATLSIQGSGGQPPYSLLILPTGPSPLPNKVEVRSIMNIPFPGTSTTLSFNLNYPENSSFVAVVSDKSGFGTGGASTSIVVPQSSNSSCYSTSNPSKIPWFFYFQPTGGLTQCELVRLWWDASLVNGSVNFYGTIPGGTSFAIPQGSLSSNNATGTGFNWTVDIVGGTNVLFIGNDDRGIGAGGVAAVTIADTMDSSCLNNNSPSSTAGNPAGGSYPTSPSSGNVGYPTNTSEPSSSGSAGHSSSNMGAIIGGVVGAVIFLVSTGLVAFWFFRRRLRSALSQPRQVNVLQDDLDGNEEDQWHYLPQNYAPQPFLLPDPSNRGTSEPTSIHDDRPLSMTTVTTDVQSPLTPTSKRSFPQLPQVNIIQHQDAGPSEDLSGRVEPETIELPPAYSNIREPRRSLFLPNRRREAEDES